MKRTLFILNLMILSIGFACAEKKTDPDTLFVAKDGTAKYSTIGEALAAINPYRQHWQVIYVKKGVYKEKLLVRDFMYTVEICGEDRDSTIITYDDYGRKADPKTGKAMGTFATYTLRIDGQRIMLRNITVENPTKIHSQAVALHTTGDRLVFDNCRFLGFVDTIFTGNIGSRLFFP